MAVGLPGEMLGSLPEVRLNKLRLVGLLDGGGMRAAWAGRDRWCMRRRRWGIMLRP